MPSGISNSASVAVTLKRQQIKRLRLVGQENHTLAAGRYGSDCDIGENSPKTPVLGPNSVPKTVVIGTARAGSFTATKRVTLRRR